MVNTHNRRMTDPKPGVNWVLWFILGYAAMWLTACILLGYELHKGG